MRLHSLTARRSAFTLIELLVVITIIGVLAAIAFPVTTAVLDKARKLKTRAVLKDLQVAIKAYQTEYNRYPSSSSSDATELTNGQIVNILLGTTVGNFNTRGIQFIDLPMAKNGRGGLIGNTGNYQLVDDYGNPYVIMMDTDYNNQISNPDVGNSDPNVSSGASNILPMGVAIYSYGKDGQPQTKDDLASWRS